MINDNNSLQLLTRLTHPRNKYSYPTHKISAKLKKMEFRKKPKDSTNMDNEGCSFN